MTDGQLLTLRPSAAPAALEYCGDAPRNDQCGKLLARQIVFCL